MNDNGHQKVLAVKIHINNVRQRATGEGEQRVIANDEGQIEDVRQDDENP